MLRHHKRTQIEANDSGLVLEHYLQLLKTTSEYKCNKVISSQTLYCHDGQGSSLGFRKVTSVRRGNFTTVTLQYNGTNVTCLYAKLSSLPVQVMSMSI